MPGIGGDIDLTAMTSSLDETIRNGLRGSVAFFSLARNNKAAWKAYEDCWRTHGQYLTYMNSLLPSDSWGQLRADFFTSTPSTMNDVSAFAYDAVATVGLAGCAAADTSGPTLFSAIKALDYEGVSGNVKFDSWGTRDPTTGNFVLQNLQPGAESVYRTVASYDATAAKLSTSCAQCTGSGIVYYDGTTNPPSDTWGEDADWQLILIISLCSAFGVFLLGYIAYKTYRVVVKHLEFERSKVEATNKQIREALANTAELDYPMAMIRATDFMMLGAVAKYEELRDAGKLIVKDTMEKVALLSAALALPSNLLSTGESFQRGVSPGVFKSSVDRME